MVRLRVVAAAQLDCGPKCFDGFARVVVVVKRAPQVVTGFGKESILRQSRPERLYGEVEPALLGVNAPG